MRKNQIIALVLIAFLFVWGIITQRYAYSKDENDLKKCVKDSDCFLADTCTGCNQCFSKSPLVDGIDCMAKCMQDENLECKCINGYCSSAKKTVLEKNQIWVSKIFSGGGIQCREELPAFPLPTLAETLELLRENNIVAIDKKEELRPVCEACGCPNSSVMHSFLINEKDLEVVNKLGFKTDSPFVDETRGYRKIP